MTIYPHSWYLRKQRLLKIEEELKTYQVATLSDLVSVNHKQAVWRIILSQTDARYMAINFGCIDNEFYVVHVDAKWFYYYWLKSSLARMQLQRFTGCLLIEDMPNDYKFNKAVGGFEHRISSPVPLAHVFADIDIKGQYIGFVNGITRTMWLLVNGAKSFPIQVHGKDPAEHLYAFAGIGEPPQTFADLKAKYSVKHPYHDEPAPLII